MRALHKEARSTLECRFVFCFCFVLLLLLLFSIFFIDLELEDILTLEKSNIHHCSAPSVFRTCSNYRLFYFIFCAMSSVPFSALPSPQHTSGSTLGEAVSGGLSALSSLAAYLSCLGGIGVSGPGSAPWPRTLSTPHKGVLSVMHCLGEGAAGYVLLVQAADGARYAAKFSIVQTPEARLAARREVEVHLALAAARSPHVVPLLDYSFVRVDAAGVGGDDDTVVEHVVLLLPLYNRGSLAAVMAASGGCLPAGTALRATGEIATALAHLHSLSPPIAHRDVCPRNVLVDGDGAALGDFGSAGPAILPTPTRADALRVAEAAAVQSSAPYRAPELWDPPSGASAAVTASADIFSLGATLFALACGLSPFESQRGVGGSLAPAEPSLLRALAPPPWPVPCPLPPDAVALVNDMLAVDPRRRPAASDVARRCAALAAALVNDANVVTAAMP